MCFKFIERANSLGFNRKEPNYTSILIYASKFMSLTFICLLLHSEKYKVHTVGWFVYRQKLQGVGCFDSADYRVNQQQTGLLILISV